MKRVVADACVAAKWSLPEPYSDATARRVRIREITFALIGEGKPLP